MPHWVPDPSVGRMWTQQQAEEAAAEEAAFAWMREQCAARQQPASPPAADNVEPVVPPVTLPRVAADLTVQPDGDGG